MNKQKDFKKLGREINGEVGSLVGLSSFYLKEREKRKQQREPD